MFTDRELEDHDGAYFNYDVQTIYFDGHAIPSLF